MKAVKTNNFISQPKIPRTQPYKIETRIQQDEMFRLATENSAIGLALLAPSGKWLKVNQSLCDIVGYTQEELLELDFQTITHPDDLNADLELVDQMLAGETATYNLHKRYFHKNGNTIWILLTVSLVRDEYNQPLYFIAQIQDRTEEYLANEQLELAHSEMQEFTAKLSHDIRSPLSSSLRVIQFAEQELAEGDTEQALDAMQIVKTQLDKLYNLSNEILEIRKAQLVQEPTTTVDIKTVVEDTLSKFSHLENFDRLTVNLNIDNIPLIQTRPSCLVSIIDNLMSNAIKYQDLKESHPYVTIECFEKNHRILFEISDNGLGIDQCYHEQIFGMFQRFHGNTVQGSGLGLYLIKKCTQVIGGTIKFIPLEKGSQFLLSIPII